MKTLIIIISILLLGGGTSYWALTTRPKGNTTEVVVLRDITDKELAKPEPDRIQSLFGLDENMYNGAVFRFADLSDVSLNQTQESHISSADVLFSNEFDRKKTVKKFQENVSTILAESLSTKLGRPHSSIYIPLANTLNTLSASRSEKRILLVYSDLMENTPDCSFYYSRGLNLLQNKQERLKTYFERIVPLQNLSDIEVHLIYKPRTAEHDKTYRLTSNLFRSMFEAKGATVFIEANF